MKNPVDPVTPWQESYTNSLPNGKILDWSKLKAFADDETNVAEMIVSLSDWVENNVGKGENLTIFSKAFLYCSV